MLQPRAYAVETLGFVPIGVNFSTLFPLLHHHAPSSTNPSGSSGTPVTAYSEVPQGQYPPAPTTASLPDADPPPGTGLEYF